MKAGDNPYLPLNYPLALKATLPQRGRVEAKNKPDQVRTKSEPSPNQARTKSEPSRFAQALFAHLCTTPIGAPQHPANAEGRD